MNPYQEGSAAMPDRVDLLQEAINLTSGDRARDYGAVVENHQHIANIFNAITGHNMTARDAAVFHIATKLARTRTSPTKRDSWVDLMAYAGIAFECAVSEANHADNHGGADRAVDNNG